MELEYLLRNSQYKNLKVEQVKSEDKWQITDTKNRVRFKDIPTKVYETIKEITKINNESEGIQMNEDEVLIANDIAGIMADYREVKRIEEIEKSENQKKEEK